MRKTHRDGLAAFCLCILIASTAHVRANRDESKTVQKTIRLGARSVNLTLAAPSAGSPPFLVVFASGDGGLHGVSKDLLLHLAARNYRVAGFSSPEAFKDIADDAMGEPNYAAARDRL